jgi:branched-chain amino acid transport system permease protein
VIVLVFPLVFTNPTVTSFGVLTLIYVTAAVSWNAFSGFTGYIALGHAVFFGVGAYTVALMAKDLRVAGGYTVFALLLPAAAAAGVVAVPFGLIALRTRRHTFVVITIAVFFIFQLAAYNLSFTGGSSGLQAPLPTWAAATFNDRFYYVGLALAVLTIAGAWAVRRSRYGLHLLAIRDDEDRARGLGVRAGRAKLVAFTASAVPVGAAGGLWFYFIGQAYPQYAFDPLFDVTVALMAFLGGLGTLSGPVLGALLLEPVQQWVTLEFSVGSLYLIIYGALFLVVILFLPAGIVPSLAKLVRR